MSQSDISAARQVFTDLQAALASAVAHAAAQTTQDGRIDGARADAIQSALYALALVHADCRAVEALLGNPPDTSLDRDLALLFAAEVAPACVARLEAIAGDIALPHAELDAVRATPWFHALRTAASGARLDALGDRVARGESFGVVARGEDAELAGDAFARFAAEVVAPLAERIHRDDLTVPETLLQPLREMGVFGLSIPSDYGGSAGAADNSPLMLAVTEALSQASLAAAGSLITRPEILARALLAGGTNRQKHHWLPRIASGDPLCAIAITEPDHGSDVAALRLRATRTEGGWHLDGAKTWCTFAGKAGLLMVVARTDPDPTLGHRGLSLMLVEKPSYDGHDFVFSQSGGGTLTGRAIPTVGYRGMHSFDLAFEGFFVPDDQVIGEHDGLGRGFYLTMAGMTGGRIQTAGRALGVMRAALDAAIDYARDRRVFGSPLSHYQLTRAKLARMAAHYLACRQFAYEVAVGLDRGGDSSEASLAKLISCCTAEWITREAQQIHGGMGYAEEMAVSRYWVDARVLSIFEGAEETLALKVIARRLLEASLAGATVPSAVNPG